MSGFDRWMYERSEIMLAAIGFLLGLLVAMAIVVGITLAFDLGQLVGALVGFTLGAICTLAGQAIILERWG